MTFMLSHGMFEFVLMGVLFMGLGKHMTGSYRKPWGVLFIGYFFAWFGHFIVERNRVRACGRIDTHIRTHTSV